MIREDSPYGRGRKFYPSDNDARLGARHPLAYPTVEELNEVLWPARVATYCAILRGDYGSCQLGSGDEPEVEQGTPRVPGRRNRYKAKLMPRGK